MTVDIFKEQLGIEPDEKVLMLAPMEGITNSLYRDLFLTHSQPHFVATEFIRISNERQKIKSIHRHSEATLQVQFMASEGKELASTVQYLKEKGLLFEEDWIDLNVGCPSRRVNSHGAGAALLKDPPKLLEIVSALRESHLSGALSVKTRLGFDSSEELPKLIDTLALLPIDFLTLHARSRCGGAQEPIRLEMLAKAVKELPFPVIGNGDINTAEDAAKMLEQTGVRGLMCGRGALKDPLLFEKIKGRAFTTSEERNFLNDFCFEVLHGYEQRSENGKRLLGVYKEFLGWISQNPLMPNDLFARVKRCGEFSEMKKALTVALALALEDQRDHSVPVNSLAQRSLPPQTTL